MTAALPTTNVLFGAKKFVVHQNPDDDCMACLWLASRVCPGWNPAQVELVPSGQSLAGSEGDLAVVHFDTGGGPFDQHGKKLGRNSSAVMLAEYLGLAQDPAYTDILEMTVRVDNAEEIPPTDLHFIVEGLRYKYRKGELTLVQLIEQVFNLYEMIASQGVMRASSRENLKAKAQWLPAGREGQLKICVLPGSPWLRDAAFEEGADVVVWSQTKLIKGEKFRYIGIFVSRDSDLSLGHLVARLRRAEMKRRSLVAASESLSYAGESRHEPCWFMHESGKLVLNGSQSHQHGSIDEVSKLGLGEIVRLTQESLVRF